MSLSKEVISPMFFFAEVGNCFFNLAYRARTSARILLPCAARPFFGRVFSLAETAASSFFCLADIVFSLSFRIVLYSLRFAATCFFAAAFNFFVLSSPLFFCSCFKILRKASLVSGSPLQSRSGGRLSLSVTPTSRGYIGSRVGVTTSTTSARLLQFLPTTM